MRINFLILTASVLLIGSESLAQTGRGSGTLFRRFMTRGALEYGDLHIGGIEVVASGRAHELQRVVSESKVYIAHTGHALRHEMPVWVEDFVHEDPELRLWDETEVPLAIIEFPEPLLVDPSTPRFSLPLFDGRSDLPFRFTPLFAASTPEEAGLEAADRMQRWLVTQLPDFTIARERENLKIRRD